MGSPGRSHFRTIGDPAGGDCTAGSVPGCTPAATNGCGREDSNLHPRRDRDLNPARLPVPPRPQRRPSSGRPPSLRPVLASRAHLGTGSGGFSGHLLHLPVCPRWVLEPGNLVPMASDPAIPSVLSASGGPEPSADIYQRLLKERIVFIGSAIDQNTANLVCAQLILLEAEDHERDISLYINSPGGSVTDGLAIYDTMQYVRPDVSTICVGLAASMGQFLLCSGAPGKRYALPHSRILMHQPSGAMQGQAADIAIQAEQIVYLKRMMAERIAFHTGQPIERIEADSDRDRWFTAEEALRVRVHRPGHRPVDGPGRRQLNVALDAPAPPPGARPRLEEKPPAGSRPRRSPTPRRWPTRTWIAIG